MSACCSCCSILGISLYPHVAVTACSGQSPFTVGFKVCRVDGVGVVVPCYQQRGGLHGSGGELRRPAVQAIKQQVQVEEVGVQWPSAGSFAKLQASARLQVVGIAGVGDGDGDGDDDDYDDEAPSASTTDKVEGKLRRSGVMR